MKRLFTRRTAGTDAKVDRLVMEYTRRSAASPLLLSLIHISEPTRP